MRKQGYRLQVVVVRLITVAILLIVLLYPVTYKLFPIFAAPPCDTKVPVDQRSADCPAGLDQLEAMVGNIISVVVGLGFIASLVMLVSAGIKYLISGGEPKAIQSAHFTLTWALLGVVFLTIAWLVLQLIENFTGVKVTSFDIKTLCEVGGKQFCSPLPSPTH